MDLSVRDNSEIKSPLTIVGDIYENKVRVTVSTSRSRYSVRELKQSGSGDAGDSISGIFWQRPQRGR